MPPSVVSADFPQQSHPWGRVKEWARGRSWRAACRACGDALEGWRGARDARRAFVKAAERAGFAGRRPLQLRKPSPTFRSPHDMAARPSFSSAG
ncbi:MAG: DUF982 domain-containing protein [Rhizobiales bacterium]|nr:DUF982 domain-containing protein [Hyphomicrobiales bacterium]